MRSPIVVLLSACVLICWLLRFSRNPPTGFSMAWSLILLTVCNRHSAAPYFLCRLSD